SAELQRPRIRERRAVPERRTRREVHRPEGVAVERVQQVDTRTELPRIEVEDLSEAQVGRRPRRPHVVADVRQPQRDGRLLTQRNRLTERVRRTEDVRPLTAHARLYIEQP